jgi:hypothetical protein
MRNYIWLLPAMLAASAPALAQDAAPALPTPSPTEQALTQRLMQEIGNGINCSSGAITLQRQLADAQAKIRELQAKLDKAPAK